MINSLLKKLIALAYLNLIAFSLLAQDTSYVRRIITDLASPDFHGRGYVKNGDKKAAGYLLSEVKQLGLKSFNDTYTQDLSFPVNTYPGKVEISANGNVLIPGVDYLVRGDSPSLKGKFKIAWINKKVVEHEDALVNMINNVDKNYFIAIDTAGIENETILDLIKFIRDENPTKAKGIIWMNYNNLIYRPYKWQKKFVTIEMKPESFDPDIQEINLNLKARFRKKHRTENVIAFYPGQVDTFIVMVAHYDHIGRMGNDCYFPGANDNASGSAAVLDFARHISSQKEKPYYSYAFMWFAAEEVGLLGSKYYTEHPFFPLNQIKYLFNYDMVGTGDEGLSIVNALTHPDLFERIERLNEEHGFFDNIRGGKASSNSDHYYFTTHDITAFFFFTRGEFRAYHNIHDKAQDVPLSGYEPFFQLILKFIDQIESIRY